MTDEWTLVIAVATSATAIIALITLLRLEQQRRINQSDPMFCPLRRRLNCWD